MANGRPDRLHRIDPFAPPEGSLTCLIRACVITANRPFCRITFGIRAPSTPPLPSSGPVILVSNHASFTDPMVLFATANRPIRFLMAREYYARSSLRWLFRLAGSIPVSRGHIEVSAIRAMLHVLARGEVLGVFPEGGIEEYRKEEGYRGVGYLALKTGAPVIPAAITWHSPRPIGLLRSLIQSARATVRYGPPLVFSRVAGDRREQARAATDRILQAIRKLQDTEK